MSNIKILSSKLYEKSPYLSSLAKRKKKTLERVEAEKASILIDKVLGRDHTFIRDYSVFSYNKPSVSKSYQGTYLKIKPGIKVNVKSQTEIDYPNRYQPKPFIADSFSMMYKQKHKKQSMSSHKLSSSNNNRIFSSVGNNIVTTMNNRSNINYIDESVMVTNKNLMKHL